MHLSRRLIVISVSSLILVVYLQPDATLSHARLCTQLLLSAAGSLHNELSGATTMLVNCNHYVVVGVQTNPIAYR